MIVSGLFCSFLCKPAISVKAKHNSAMALKVSNDEFNGLEPVFHACEGGLDNVYRHGIKVVCLKA